MSNSSLNNSSEGNFTVDVSSIQNVQNMFDPRTPKQSDKLKECLIDENIRFNKNAQPHSCMLSSECTGARICTSFGWCRGKKLCYDNEVKAAC